MNNDINNDLNNNVNKIDPLEEAITISWLEGNLSASHEEALFNAPVVHMMSAGKREDIINKLYERASILSFGELLAKSFKENCDTSNSVILNTEVIDDLKKDKIAVNNIPVFILKEFLEELKISFNEAKAAIKKSFEIITTNTMADENTMGLSPSYRKGRTDSMGDGVKRMPNKALFENEESLNKYLDRLEQLMK